jgi:O-succinylbenzoate synthase
MKIERIEARLLRLPLRFPFETSFGVSTYKEFLLVSVSADGVTGHAECVADVDPFYLPETNATALHILSEFLVPMALETEVAHPRDYVGLFARVRGHEMAKAALEMAAYELLARQESAPLYRVLGGRGGEIASGVSVGLQADVAATLDKVSAEVGAGYRRVKIKIKPGKDEKLVTAIRERFPDVALMVDANSAYTLEHAPLFRRLDAYKLMMIEQPLAWDDIVDHVELQKQIATPVCLDESIHGPDDARHALDLGACRIINVKVGRVGGHTRALAIESLCRERGVPVWCGGMLESGIGRLHNVHLQTRPGFTLPGDTSASARYFEEDLVDPPVTVSRQGTITVPEKPGIGHEIVWSRVEKATLHKQVWPA